MILIRIICISILIGLTACSGIKTIPAPDIYVNKYIDAPPYYCGTTKAAGNVVIFSVHLDPLRDTIAESEVAIDRYLVEALPKINKYLKGEIPGGLVAPYEHVKPENFWHGLSYDFNADSDSNLHLQDLPRLHFGNPQWVVRDYDFYTHNGEKENMLTVINPSKKWRFHHERFMQSVAADSLLDISLGIVQIAVDREGLWNAQVLMGSELTANHEGELKNDGAVDVVAFKGNVYDKQGNIVNCGIEGFIPIWPNAEINSLEDLFSSTGLEDTEELDNLEEYPWRDALDALLNNLM